MKNNPSAFVFPGQGSQSLRMLCDFASTHPVVEETFAKASSILGYDLWKLTQEGPEAKLNQTEYTQPALLTSSIALWHIYQGTQTPNPNYLAGHSLGEYSALVCANAIDFGAAVQLVADRGRFMQEAVKPGEGAMAAIIGLTNEQVEDICKQAAQGEIVSAANFNAIGQVVIAGHTEAVRRAIELAKQAGAKIAKEIPVSVPSHCELMKPAAERLAKRLANINIKAPQIPVIHNVDVCSYASAEEIRSALIRQLYCPVRWVETIQYLVSHGVKTAIECGPGKVLAGLNKRIDSTFSTFSPTFEERQ
jgi:[acyl-carrier-protein] S-malonyltransferase